MKPLLALAIAVLLAGAQAKAEDTGLLARMDAIRAKFDQDRARANQQSAGPAQLAGAAVDAPSVTDMRRDMQQSLTAFQQSFRCLDIDVNSKGGNTTIVCGDNNGGVSSRNTTAGRDILGGAP